MKKMILAALLLHVAMVNAAQITVLDAELPMIDSFRSSAYANFNIDQTTGEGFVEVSVIERRTIRDGGSIQVFKDLVKVDGLVLIDEKVIYQSVEGDIECGTLGLSRVFKRPTIYLSGNCKLSPKIIRDRMIDRVLVTLKTE